MSLLDAFLEDGLAASVLAKSDVWFAIRKDGAVGSGSQEDPFDGSTAAHFDAAMSAVASNTTIHIGPGEFLTTGGGGWQPKSGQCIVGAGINATTLKLDRATAAGSHVVIGNPASSSDPNPIYPLDGFDVSDLSIDCNFSTGATPTSASGISVTGKHVYVRRVLVKKFGAKTGGVCVGISAAWAKDASGAQPAIAPYDCLIDACQAVLLSGEGGSGTLMGLRLGQASGSSQFHNACGIRNCTVDLGDDGVNFSRDSLGLVSSGGSGTIVEGNVVKNSKYAGPVQLSSEGMNTLDLIVRDNVFSWVQFGISLELGSTQTIGRVVLLNNQIELGTSSTGVWNGTGIRLSRESGYGITSAIIRGNVLRPDGVELSPSNDFGIQLSSCSSVIVSDNIIDFGIANNAVYHTNCGNVAPFNNQTSGGEFRPGFDGTYSVHDQELTTEVEDVLLGILMH